MFAEELNVGEASAPTLKKKKNKNTQQIFSTGIMSLIAYNTSTGTITV